MRFRNPFSRRRTPGYTTKEIIELIRPIAAEHPVSEGYLRYDNIADVDTDRPDSVLLFYTMVPGSTMEDAEAFNEEIRGVFHGSVVPLPTSPYSNNLQIARMYRVPLFRS